MTERTAVPSVLATAKSTMAIHSDAVLSRCGMYRYALWRWWDPDRPVVMFIGLNPSTADAHQDDPTIRRCISFASSWGFGGMCIGNLFAYRSVDPRMLPLERHPVGPHNDRWLLSLASEAKTVVAAWGNMGILMDRSAKISMLIPNLQYIKMNRSGEPAHPLYLPANRGLSRFK